MRFLAFLAPTMVAMAAVLPAVSAERPAGHEVRAHFQSAEDHQASWGWD